MSLRLKIVIALVLLAAGATAAIGTTSYLTTRRELQQVVDRSLDAAAQSRDLLRLAVASQGDPSNRPRPRSFDQILVQAIDVEGRLIRSITEVLPVTDADRAVARSTDPGARTRHDVRIDGEPYRVLTVKSQAGGAILIGRSLRESRESLAAILRHTLWAVLIVIVASALVGWLIARRVTMRLVRLTAAADDVATSGRLDVAVPADGDDEVGRLGQAFGGMLGALARSRHEQTQLVQDAGHELRTPLTSLRTNVSVLRSLDRLSPEQRDQVVADLDSETRELTSLVNELVELASDQRDAEPLQTIRLTDIAEHAAARTRRRTGREVVVTGDATGLVGRPLALERAVQNLVDNATKFAPEGPVEIIVEGGSLTVRDHGSGIAEADLPHVFDRFYRAVDRRSLPGSGLGLSIVKSVVDEHHGTVFARNAHDPHDRGAMIGFVLPVS